MKVINPLARDQLRVSKGQSESDLLGPSPARSQEARITAVFLVAVLWLLGGTAAVNVSQMATLDKSALLERIGVLPQDKLAQIDAGVRLVLGI